MSQDDDLQYTSTFNAAELDLFNRVLGKLTPMISPRTTGKF
jgi:hypothetical protein